MLKLMAVCAVFMMIAFLRRRKPAVQPLDIPALLNRFPGYVRLPLRKRMKIVSRCDARPVCENSLPADSGQPRLLVVHRKC